MGKKRELGAELIQAAIAGNVELIRAQLAAGLPVDAENEDGHTALMEAAFHCQAEALKALLEAGANPKRADSLALDFAVRFGNVECVRLLLSAGADPHRGKKTNDPPPLFEALVRGNVEMVEALLGSGARVDAKVNGSGLLSAAIYGKNADCIARMIECGAGTKGSLQAAVETDNAALVDLLLQHRVDPDESDQFGKTAVALAAYYGRTGIVAKLLRAGAKIDVADSFGQTPLYDAVSNGHLESAAMLLEAGAPLKSNAAELLESAIAEANPSLVALLLKHGAHPDKAVSGRLPPLFQALAAGQLETVRLLLASKADPNLKLPKKIETDDDVLLPRGCTPLMLAAKKGDVKSLALLLECGADPKAVDANGKSAADHAGQTGHTAAVEMLASGGAPLTTDERSLQAAILLRALANGDEDAAIHAIESGADTTATDRDGVPPLIHAVRNGMEDAVRSLLTKGADANQSTPRGETPLRAACLRTNAAIVQLLLEHGAEVNRFHAPGSIPANERNTVYGSLDTALHDAAVYSTVEIIDLLLKAGADLQARTKENLSPVVAAANHRRMENVQRLLEAGAEVRPEDEIWMAPYHFTRRADCEAYRSLVAELAAATGNDAEPMSHLPGIMAFKISLEESDEPPANPMDSVEAARRWGEQFAKDYSALDQRAAELVRQFDDKTRERRFLLVNAGKPIGCGPMVQYLVLLPSDDKFEAMAAFGVRANDQEMGTGEIIEWFRQLDAEQPFRLRGVKFDTVEIEFETPVRDPAGLAKRVNAFCHDMAGGEKNGWKSIAKILRSSRKLHFWWD